MYKIKTLLNADMFLSLLAAAMQQCMVAASTFVIINLAEAVVAGDPVYKWLGFFILLLTTVYLPSACANYFLRKSMFRSLGAYVESFASSFRGHAALRADEAFKSERKPYVVNESWIVLEESHTFILDFFSTCMSVCLNILVLSSVIDSRLSASYLLALPLIIISLRLSSKKIEKTSDEAQKCRAGMMQRLGKGWDSVLIGNVYNFNLWSDKFKASIYKAKTEGVRAVAWVELVSSLSMVLSLAPVLAAIVFLFSENSGNVKVLVALVATLPRQVQIIQYMSDIVYHATQWTGIRTRLEGLHKTLDVPDAKDRESLVSFNEIETKEINGADIRYGSASGFARQIKAMENGRFTVRGRNGSGKSVLLSSLKDILKDDCFYLPTSSDLVFSASDGQSLSTGQKMKMDLTEIQGKVEAKYVLLDEWDANLDAAMSDEISDCIDKISKTSVVVEVRHRI